MDMAKSAALKVLETLTQYDQATIVDFSSLSESWSSKLKPMTDENKDPDNSDSI